MPNLAVWDNIIAFELVNLDRAGSDGPLTESPNSLGIRIYLNLFTLSSHGSFLLPMRLLRETMINHMSIIGILCLSVYPSCILLCLLISLDGG